MEEMAEKASEKVKTKTKGREKKETVKVMSSFAVLTIVLSVLTASVATVSAPDGPPPPGPEVTEIVVTASPLSIPADGSSTSTITATVTNWTNVTSPIGFSIKFDITPEIATIYPKTNITDVYGNARTTLTAGLIPGVVTVKAYWTGWRDGTPYNVSNTTTVILTGPPKITGYNNKTGSLLSVTINESECVYFNATADQPINYWRWYKDSVLVQNSTSNEFTACWAVKGTYSVAVNATNANGTSNTTTWAVTVKDIKPPASISNLASTTGNFWINWTWTNPLDADFNHTMVYIDGSHVTNVTKPQNWYNATYTPHATRTIATRTVDTSGNINTTWVNQTRTIPNNVPVLDPIGPKFPVIGETLTIDANATDLDGDTLTYSCNRTGWFTDFNTATGKGNWTPSAAGTYYVDFGVADGYGGIDNETVMIIVSGTGVDLKVEGTEYAEKTVAPSKNATYLLTVKNIGSIADTYTLLPENPNGADVAALNRTTITNLAPGVTADVLLNVSDALGGEYVVNVTATGTYPGVSDKVRTKTIVSAMGSVTGKITYTHNGTGIAGVNVNLTKGGSVISSTVTNATGYYNFTDVTPDSYFVNASKLRFWGNSTSVTVTAGATTTANMMLWLKGDLNNNGISADKEDTTLMFKAYLTYITPDYRYDLNKNGVYADKGDVVLMFKAYLGYITLE